MNPLFHQFPRLRSALPFIQLGTFPTPVTPLTGFSPSSGAASLYCKRDDVSSDLYGGNKVRKLEFILAEVRRQQIRRVITSGAAGSNHAFATALYGKQCGFKVTLMLFEQPQQPAIGRTLLADQATGADMHHDTTYELHRQHLRTITRTCGDTDGTVPYIIPPGGSSPLGTIGFVNAAFELRDQIRQGILPEPAAIYVAFGTMGTAAGLLLGLRAAGLQCRVIAVRVVPDFVANEDSFGELFTAANALLHDSDGDFPVCTFNHRHFTIYDDFLGDGYGYATPEANNAIDRFRSNTDIHLDPVYTGKCGAAFLADASSTGTPNHPLLFWHTKSGRLPPLPAPPPDFHDLPKEFHRYFA